MEDRMSARAKADLEAQRQAQMDATAAEDHERRITTEDRAYTDQQEWQRIDDARQGAEQQQRCSTARMLTQSGT